MNFKSYLIGAASCAILFVSFGYSIPPNNSETPNPNKWETVSAIPVSDWKLFSGDPLEKGESGYYEGRTGYYDVQVVERRQLDKDFTGLPIPYIAFEYRTFTTPAYTYAEHAALPPDY